MITRISSSRQRLTLLKGSGGRILVRASLRTLLRAPGRQGSSGLSAYQIALANGFIGTEAQWLTSLSAGNLPWTSTNW